MLTIVFLYLAMPAFVRNLFSFSKSYNKRFGNIDKMGKAVKEKISAKRCEKQQIFNNF
jgi:hypothetical protein